MATGNGCTISLMDHCYKAVGHVQVMDGIQPRLLVATPLTLGQIGGNIRFRMEPYITQGGVVIDYSAEEMAIITATPITLVGSYELISFDPNSINIASNHIVEIQNWRTYSDCKIGRERAFLRTCMLPGIDEWALRKKEGYYWALRLRNKSRFVVPAILDSAKQLKCTEWVLPNGIKVSTNRVKAIALEVIPNQSYLFQLFKYVQTGGAISTDGSLVTPYVRRDDSDFERMPFLKIFFRRVLPEGITRIHHVIEATLPDGVKYIMDPTSMQYGYRGPKGSIIAHGTMEEYMKGFPGTVLPEIIEKAKYDVTYVNGDSPLTRMWMWMWTWLSWIPVGDPRQPVRMNTAIDEMYYLGEGPQKLITTLTNYLVTYVDRRFCAYCGWIEGDHRVRPPLCLQVRFKVAIMTACTRCKAVVYCEKACQKAHWKEHKTVCGKKINAPNSESL